MNRTLVVLAIVVAIPRCALAQQNQPQPAAPRPAAPATPAPQAAGGGPQLDQALKHVDDLMWHVELGDIAEVNIVKYTGLPPAKAPNPNAPGAKNPLILHAYTFIPKNLDRSKKQPLLVYVHGGVHGNFDTSEANVVPRAGPSRDTRSSRTDYRGSTGYGRGFYEQIDYGGREVDDVYQGGQWMLGNYRFPGSHARGHVGWSHGGAIALMNIFAHPQTYAVAYAGVPVSDLVMRMGYEAEGYRHSTPRPITLAGRCGRTWPSTASRRPCRTPRSCRRRC